MLQGAAKDMPVLLVLDDLWSAAHATPLNFLDGSTQRSALVVTTRVRSLLGGAREVCNAAPHTHSAHTPTALRAE